MKNITPCTEWDKKLSSTNPEDLSLSERAALTAHLATCSACALARAQYYDTDNLLRSLPPIEPLPGLPSQLLRLWEEKEKEVASSRIQLQSKHKKISIRQANSPLQL